MKELPYQLKAYAKGPDRPLRPFELSISTPYPDKDFGYRCEIVCPMIRDKPMAIYGNEPLFAAELSIQFVQRSLDHLGAELVDESGKPIDLPKFDDVPETSYANIDDDGARDGDGVLVSLKEAKNGEQILCIDDIYQSISDNNEKWNSRNSFTMLPIEDEISEEIFAQIGWNIVTRLKIRKAANTKREP